MVDVEDLPAWARRRLDRHFRRGGSGRIVRWMSVPAGGSVSPAVEADLPGPIPGPIRLADNVVVFAPRPIPVALPPAASARAATA